MVFSLTYFVGVSFMVQYDLILKNGLVVDPKNGVEDFLDLGIAEGKIVECADDLDPRSARSVIDVSGRYVFPGVIDSHVHIRRMGHKMMAKVGVITALDMAASADEVLQDLKSYGVGLNVATITNIRSLFPSSDVDLSDEQISAAVSKVCCAGALGIKITGGHRPYTPETTEKIIDECNRQGCYIGFHVGTTETGSNLNGLIEAVELAGDNGLHIAHVNSYCRGLVADPVEEALTALKHLRGRSCIASESYLARINGTSGLCVDGKPVSGVTRNCLKMRGYSQTYDGLKQALKDGYAKARIEAGGESVLVSGDEAVKYWLEAGTDIGISFPVNDPEAQIVLATAKYDDHFIVDAISTDGGGIPRNVQVEKGMLLVKFGALSLSDLAVKLSLNPARMLGLDGKGHLGVGADADITVIDPSAGKACLGISGGKIIMVEGVVVGRGGCFLTTERGEASVKRSGVDHEVIDLSKTKIYSGGLR